MSGIVQVDSCSVHLTCLYPVQFDFRSIIALRTLVGALDTGSEEKVRPTEESATRISLATP